MHRTKDALKLLSSLLSRVIGLGQQHLLFFGLARLYSKHGLKKDALVSSLPSLCNNPPDKQTWEFLKSMAEVPMYLAHATVPTHLNALRLTHVHPPRPSTSYAPHVYPSSYFPYLMPLIACLWQCTPAAVEQQLQTYIDETHNVAHSLTMLLLSVHTLDRWRATVECVCCGPLCDTE